MRLRLVSTLLLAACSSSPDHDIVGPFKGPTTRFAIDHLTLPTSNAEALQLGDDLNGDGTIDNQLGMVVGTLVSLDDATTTGDDMIDAGVIASAIELQATALDEAPRAGAAYFGAEAASEITMGGAITAGAFASNRTRTTRVPGEATLVLPVFADADPATVELHAMELDLAPDGQGGYNALVRGGVPETSLMPVVAAGIIQMVDADPVDHVGLARVVDINRDGVITPDEVPQSDLIQSLLAYDVTLFGEQLVSFGFAAHLVPRPAGGCVPAPADTCGDRVLDGDETDIDCGGSCKPCGPGASCKVAADCELGCDSGTCRAPTCSDGLQDGFETDVDCGWNCAPCPAGKMCASDQDCTSGHCDGFNGLCQ